MDSLSSALREGMDVFDSEGKHIGQVERFRFGDEDPDRPGPETDTGNAPSEPETIIEEAAEAFWPNDLPDAVRARMQREGYILLDADGILHKDRFVLPEQVESISDKGVALKVKRGDLIKA